MPQCAGTYATFVIESRIPQRDAKDAAAYSWLERTKIHSLTICDSPEITSVTMADSTNGYGSDQTAVTTSSRPVTPPLLPHDSALSLATHVPDSSEQAEYIDQTTSEDEQDNTFDDNDSAFGESLIGCDTDTLASYITDYRYENGRRYHAYRDGEYWVTFPN